MIEFSSDSKTIPHTDRDIFRVLSDLRNLDLIEKMIPDDKIKDFIFDKDSVSFCVDAIGKVSFSVIERQPDNFIRFKSEKLPFDVFMEIQLQLKSDNETELMMFVKSDLNPFMKSIVEKPMREAVDRIADALKQLPYDQI
ncbi:MAG TPA: hypothetical protein VKX35_05485 [Fermentimonas sp.]|nr:hypothetical protein [Fermentimonas sp.]